MGEPAEFISRDPIKDIYGERTPYKHEWPTRLDEHYLEKPEKWVQSACVLCSNGCGIDIGVKDGKMVGVRGRITDRVNKGRLGPKGMHAWKSMLHKDRLLYPQIRRNGKLERATWEEAMSLIVEKTKDVQRRLTKHGIAFYTSGQLFLEEYYALMMVGKAGLNTLHMDGNTRLCTATAAASMRESFGSDGQPGSYTDIDHTDCLFLVGHNISATQTVLWSRMLDRLAGPNPPKLIVVDPRESDTAKEATLHLQPKIGTNLALLNGIQHVMFERDYINHDYVDKHVVGLDILRRIVNEYPPERVSKITGVPERQIEQAAEILGKTPSLLSTCLQGVYQSNQATASACAVNNINLLRGLLGKPGSGIFQMNGQPTAQNNRECGCDGEFPAFRNPQNPKHMQELADIWNVDFIKVPHWNEPTHVQNLLNFIEQGTVEMLWISGTNPLVSLLNLPRLRRLFTQENLFVVVQDIFPNETSAIADVVLPAAGWSEKTGCFTNVDRTVHLSHKAVEPPGEARSDLDIFLDFGRRMQFEDKNREPLMPWRTSEEVFEAWKKCSKGRPCDYSGFTYEMLTGGSGIQWPCNEENPQGKERLFEDGVFFTDIDHCESYGHDLETGTPYGREEYLKMNPNGRAILKACHYIPGVEQPDEEYPFHLSTGRKVFHFHTRTKTGRTKALQEADPEPTIHISQHDAEDLGLSDGDQVLVESRRGSVQMPVKLENIAKKQTFIPFHFGYFDSKTGTSHAANELTLERWDPISKQPVFKGGAIRITKLQQTAEVTIHAKEQQTSAVQSVEQRKPNAENIHDDGKRARLFERWLGATVESITELIDIYDNLIPALIHDLEIEAGLRVLHIIAKRMRDYLQSFSDAYPEEGDTSRPNKAKALRDCTFPDKDNKSPFVTMETLQALHVFLSHIEGGIHGLMPSSQALYDEKFLEALKRATDDIHRQHAWVQQQIKSRSPQNLLVPVPV